MSENNPMDNPAATETVKAPVKVQKKRDIFRFSTGGEEMAIDLGKVWKIIRKGKKVIFVLPFPVPVAPDKEPGDWIEFIEEEATKRFFEQITGVWSADVLE